MSPPKDPPRRKVSGCRPRGVRVLVVEDERAQLEYIASELEQAGFVVLEAANGDEGLEKARSFEPDVLVLDLMLPEISGFVLARAVRSFERTRDIGIVAVSALASEALRMEALAAGCDVFLTKPVRAELVVEQVRLVLTRRDSPARRRLREV
jgi:DNA-binding response OmpR family regulator